MPPEIPPPGSVADWLRHAVSDLELAQSRTSPNILLETLCFHAQQTAEKALKAILVAHSIQVPKTHNINTLIELLPASVQVPQEIKESAILTDYAVLSRYPGDAEPVTEEEYREAIKLARAVMDWAEKVIK